MWLTWQQGAWLAVGFFAVWLATARLRWTTDPNRVAKVVRGARAFVLEAGFVAALYALWQWVYTFTLTKTAGAMSHARAIYDFEQRIGLPSERTVQQLTMHSRYLIEALNRYYAIFHVPALGAVLVWLFFWHRDRYGRFRNVLALATGGCLALQSIPVAPPRFLPDLGFVDTALRFHESVYGAGGSGISNQLAAMPSVHIAWSTLVAAAVVIVGTSRWRWLVVAHPIFTLWAVVATGNHWWLDAIVATALVGLAAGLLELAARVRTTLRDRHRSGGREGPGAGIGGAGPPADDAAPRPDLARTSS